MTTQFQALRLSDKINNVVLDMAKRNHVDLNSVNHWTDKMLIIGEEKTEKVIHIRQHGSTEIPGHELKAGIYVTLFIDGMTSEHHDLTGETL